MAFLTTTVLVSSLSTTFRVLNNNTMRQELFKRIKCIKYCDDLVRAQKHTSSGFKMGKYMQIQSCHSYPKPLETLCVHPKPVSVMLSQHKAYRAKGGYIAPITRYPGYNPMAMKETHSIASQWRLYAQAKEPDSPAPSKGGPVTTSGGGLGRLDAANERGFFHKVNKSRIEQIKQMLRDKALKKKNEDENQEPK